MPSSDSDLLTSEEEDARNKLARLFSDLKIVRAVVVDDASLPELTPTYILDAIDGNAGAAEQLRLFLPSAVFNAGEDEIRIHQIDTALAGMNAAASEALRRAVGQSKDKPDDGENLLLLRSILPREIRLDILTPQEWHKTSATHLKECSPESRVVFFFDQELNVSDPTLGFRNGADIVKSLSSSNPDDFGTRWFCAILSHTLGRGDEIDKWRSIANEYEIHLKYFMPISKSNLDHVSHFYSAVYRALVTIYCEDMKRIAKEGFEKSLKAVLERFEKFDPLDFEHMIVHTSLHEGVSELETLLRIYTILTKDAVKRSIYDSRYAGFLSAAQAVKAIADTDRLLTDHVKARLFQLRRDEIYENGDLINEFHDPLRNGDLFEIGAEKRPYVLIAQPCDLMVRNNLKGDRAREDNFKIAVLVPIEISPMPDKSQAPGSFGFNLSNFGSDGNQLGYVNFSKATVANLCVLDLSVLNEDGACLLKITEINQAKQSIPTRAWQLRAEKLVKKYKAIEKRIADAEKKYKGNDAATELAKEWLPRCGLSKNLKKLGSYSDGKFSYPIRRCGRIRDPLAIWLLSAFSRYLARDAYDHDYALSALPEEP